MGYDDVVFDFQRIFEALRIPLILTAPDMAVICANHFSREVLPFEIEQGKTLQVENFLQHEDSAVFEKMISECNLHGESVCTVKQKGTDKYYKVKAYRLKHRMGQLVLQFEDVSQSRLLEDQFYDHLVDLYSQLETQEREIADLRAVLLRMQGD